LNRVAFEPHGVPLAGCRSASSDRARAHQGHRPAPQEAIEYHETCIGSDDVGPGFVRDEHAGIAQATSLCSTASPSWHAEVKSQASKMS
jgi:hypothetical protein